MKEKECLANLRANLIKHRFYDLPGGAMFPLTRPSWVRGSLLMLLHSPFLKCQSIYSSPCLFKACQQVCCKSLTCRQVSWTLMTSMHAVKLWQTCCKMISSLQVCFKLVTNLLQVYDVPASFLNAYDKHVCCKAMTNLLQDVCKFASSMFQACY